MLRNLFKMVSDRIIPSIDQKQDGTSHCREAAFDPDSFPEAARKVLKQEQNRAAKAESNDVKS